MPVLMDVSEVLDGKIILAGGSEMACKDIAERHEPGNNTCIFSFMAWPE